jgi:glutamate-1-semialdehyde 2,1-aminomutase
MLFDAPHAPATVDTPLQREARVRSRTTGSRERFDRARRFLAGGVSTSLRRNARPYPLYFERGRGSRVCDVDGNSYLDYGLAWGPLILGHSPPELVAAVEASLRRGFTFGAQHDLELEVSQRLCEIIPCAGQVCFASSGTEIVQLALRLARAATGRRTVLKFEGHYHGWFDAILASYHPSIEETAAAGGRPVGVGLGQLPHDHLVVAQWNDQASVEDVFARAGSDIAAIICEPLMCNSSSIPPEPGFLEFLRAISRAHKALLIFDEVITGFRVHLQGAQGLYGVVPDLATYAKAVAGGAPLSVLAGARDIMDLVASGRVLHAGTMNGNPLVLAAAKATLELLARDGGAVFDILWERGERLRHGLVALLHERGLPAVSCGGGPVFSILFQDRRPTTYRQTVAADAQRYSDFAVGLLDEGVLALPDGRWYISAAHSDHDIDATLLAAARASDSLKADV